MRPILVALLALGACSSQPQPAAPVNAIQAEETNITTDASPAPLDKAPAKPAKPAKAITARFRCMDGVRITARFDPEGSATLTRAGATISLEQQVTASGIRYSNGQVTFQGKGDDMSYEAPGQPPIACTAIHG